MREPRLLPHGDALVADDATVTGRVRLSPGVSLWYGVVVRADVAAISIGRDTNVQDRTVIHPQHDEDITIGEEVVIGHGVLVHNRRIGSRSLIGMGSILLPGARIGEGCLVAAGALVPPGMEVPDGKVARGSPARLVRDVGEGERAAFRDAVARYLALAREHAGRA